MSEPTAAPELKEYPEFPGEKLSKRCVHPLRDRGRWASLRARRAPMDARESPWALDVMTRREN